MWRGVCYLIIYVKKDFRLLMLLPTYNRQRLTYDDNDDEQQKYIYRIPNFHL